jgi:hypothetical protein
MNNGTLNLSELNKNEVPEDLRAATYFDFNKHPFMHQQLFEKSNSVYGVILGIHKYIMGWLKDRITEKRKTTIPLKREAIRCNSKYGNFEVILEQDVTFEPSIIIGSQSENKCHTIYLEKGTFVIGSEIYLDKADIYIGAGTRIEPGVGIKGPTVIGQNNEIRQGAYLRGDCILGDSCTIRGELKNVVMMDKANFPHPSYVGDSICGFMTHFGNQATAANLGIYEGARIPEERKSIIVKCEGKAYDLGKPKMGICMGDFSQVGCNSVADPATFLKPLTIVYALTRITKGFYGPREVLKNKPLEYGVIERAPLKPLE